ncbi:MAG TPA: VTT domain-containing protein [bacterium]|nr:VTT domain-containing protein [bacterium]
MNLIRKIVTPFVTLGIVITSIYFSTRISADEIAGITSRLGVWGPLAIIGLVAFGHVCLPLVGAPFVVAAIKLYGLGWANVYLYGAGLISSSISFCIARRYGRKWVKRLMGTASMEMIDRLTQAHEDQLLIMARLFGFSIFELVGYASGLTAMRFRKLFIYTAGLSWIPGVLGFLLLKDLDFNTMQGFLIWLACVGGSGAVFGQYVFRVYFRMKRD